MASSRLPRLARKLWLTDFYDAVLIDLNYTRDTTSGQEGLDLLSEIVALDSNLPVIVMTAWGNVEIAVEAMRRGARDFIHKPWENERLLAILRTQIELHRALQRAERLAAENRLSRLKAGPSSSRPRPRCNRFSTPLPASDPPMPMSLSLANTAAAKK